MVGRFRPSSNWFVASRDAGVYVARSGAQWKGFDIPLPDLCDALGRLRCPLATYGGVEITVFGPDDQLSLTPDSLLVIYERSDRWYFLLEGLGLAERAGSPVPVWAPARSMLQPSPALSSALTAAAATLGLRVGTPTSAQ